MPETGLPLPTSCGLPLPCENTVASDSVALTIRNSGNGNAIAGISTKHRIGVVGRTTGIKGVGVHGIGGSIGVRGTLGAGGGIAAGVFEITDEGNNSDALFVQTVGGGRGIRTQILGTGPAGDFSIQNSGNNSPALLAHANHGAGIQADSSTGNAGFFQIASTDNNNAALLAQTQGTGAAIRGEVSVIGTGPAGVFDIAASSLNNSAALVAQTAGTGRAGFFRIANPQNGSDALVAQTAGGGAAIRGQILAPGTGSAGDFSIDNPGNNSAALIAQHLGGGPGLFGQGGIGTVAIGSTGILGVGQGANSIGGSFINGVDVNGTLTATIKHFVIDHPLDPENRSLVHASVESSEMANVYSGNASLDDNGEAWVELPAWLDALNTDFRYQLTCIGEFAPVYVAEELSNNRFKIAGGKAGMKVSWQLTGIRKDPWAQAHPLAVEEEKPANERGSYRHPEVYNQPEEKAVYRMRYADMLEGLPLRTLSR